MRLCEEVKNPHPIQKMHGSQSTGGGGGGGTDTFAGQEAKVHYRGWVSPRRPNGPREL